MIIGVTGHRDAGQKPGELEEFARLFVARVVSNGATEIITGMARGWDLAVAEAADAIGIPFLAALPFPGQDQCQARHPGAILARRGVRGIL